MRNSLSGISLLKPTLNLGQEQKAIHSILNGSIVRQIVYSL